MLLYPAFPFFHLRAQSSFNKACFCFAGTIPSFAPRAGRSLESNTWQSQLHHTDFNQPPGKQGVLFIFRINMTTYLDLNVKTVQANLCHPAQCWDHITSGMGHGFSSSYYSNLWSTFSSTFPCSSANLSGGLWDSLKIN